MSHDIRAVTFAVLGHPNEGKSSVVSTLAENDRVTVSPTPGETRACHTYPVRIDGRECIRFVDTPGFQNPKRTLAWFQAYNGPDDLIVKSFRETHSDHADFRHEVELLKPLEEKAGVVYVVDGSRPVRGDDLAEMEILRRTGLPRVAVINNKETETRYLDDWKNAFRKTFNVIRIFNAHHANYTERLALLETLKGVDPDWEGILTEVIQAFRADWRQRNEHTADRICVLLEDAIRYRAVVDFPRGADIEERQAEVEQQYRAGLSELEKQAHKGIRKLYKHNIFNYSLPPHSLLHEDLFAKRTWTVLGLSRWRLAVASALAGGAGGAGIDLALGQITFGVFAAGGFLAGGTAALLGGPQLAQTGRWGPKLFGRWKIGPRLGHTELALGPSRNIQLFYVLLDRALIFYSHVINWAHGRRDYSDTETHGRQEEKGFSQGWAEAQRRSCSRYFQAIRVDRPDQLDAARDNFTDFLLGKLTDISGS